MERGNYTSAEEILAWGKELMEYSLSSNFKMWIQLSVEEKGKSASVTATFFKEGTNVGITLYEFYASAKNKVIFEKIKYFMDSNLSVAEIEKEIEEFEYAF